MRYLVMLVFLSGCMADEPVVRKRPEPVRRKIVIRNYVREIDTLRVEINQYEYDVNQYVEDQKEFTRMVRRINDNTREYIRTTKEIIKTELEINAQLRDSLNN
jgi:hypothetical protein